MAGEKARISAIGADLTWDHGARHSVTGGCHAQRGDGTGDGGWVSMHRDAHGYGDARLRCAIDGDPGGCHSAYSP